MSCLLTPDLVCLADKAKYELQLLVVGASSGIWKPSYASSSFFDRNPVVTFELLLHGLEQNPTHSQWRDCLRTINWNKDCFGFSEVSLSKPRSYWEPVCCTEDQNCAKLIAVKTNLSNQHDGKSLGTTRDFDTETASLTTGELQRLTLSVSLFSITISSVSVPVSSSRNGLVEGSGTSGFFC